MMTRRQFLHKTTASALVLGSLSARSADRVAGANERVRVGLIGCGGRGNLVGQLMSKVPGVEFVALCDVYEPLLGPAKEWAGNHCKTFGDFRRLLELKDVDAVLIATPDHWHAIPAVFACQAGKDVYLEKPLAYSVGEGQKIIKAVRQHNIMLQVGTQHRSAPHYAEMSGLVKSGALGPIHFVRIWNYVNMYPRGIGAAPNSTPPPGADWDFFLGPAPEVPFNQNRFIKTYRWFWDYGGGLVSDFGVHRFDSLHQVMRIESAPRTVHAVGGRFELQDGCETPDFVQVTVEYPGCILSYEASMLNAFGTGVRGAGQKTYQARGEFDLPHGEAFYGTNGTLISSRLGYELFPELDAQSGPGAVGRNEPPRGYKMERKSVQSADRTDLHVRNFIECVRSRKAPVANVEVGYRSSLIAHLANISYRTGRKIAWDSAKEEIVGDAEAARYLWREPRKKWDVI